MYRTQTPKARANEAARLLRHAADSIVKAREAQELCEPHFNNGITDSYCEGLARDAPMLARRVYEYNVVSEAYA